jgi:hypothetical protein
VEVNDSDGALSVTKDIDLIIAEFPRLLSQCIIDPDIRITWFVHQGEIFGGEKEARDKWRVIFAEALLRWDAQLGRTK